MNGGGVTTTGAQSYTGQMTLGANTILTGTTGTFTGGIVGGGGDLDLRFSNDNTIPGAGLTGVRNLTAGNGEGGLTIIDGDITTTGSQTYNDNVRIDANVTLNSTGNDITFTAAADAADADAAGNTRTLAITGNLVVGDGGAADAIGASQSLASVTVSGNTRFNSTAAATVTTAGIQTYGDNPVADATFLTQNATLSGVGITFNSGINGNQALVVNDSGTTAFNGTVGGTGPLASVTTDAAGTTHIDGGAVTTSGTQTYNDNVELGVPTPL
jgi:hypothetical protein